MEWELVKENFQPLRAGRKPVELIKAASKPTAQCDNSAAEQRRCDWRWKRSSAVLAGSKWVRPLSVYLQAILAGGRCLPGERPTGGLAEVRTIHNLNLAKCHYLVLTVVRTPHRFIKWTQETFASGGHQAELIPLLERCTRELQDLPQYKDDVRYLRVWIQYVSAWPPAPQRLYCSCSLDTSLHRCCWTLRVILLLLGRRTACRSPGTSSPT